MKDFLKILLVEDSQNDVILLTNELNKHYRSDIHVVEQENDYRKELNLFQPDIILSDYNLPVFDGMKALTIRQEFFPLTPFILVTGSINEETAVECIKAGADDYILKEHMNRLSSAIKSAIENKDNIRAKEIAEEKYRTLSLSVEQSPISVVITDNKGKIVFVNPKFCEVTGYSSREAIGKNSNILNSGETPKEEYALLWDTILAGNVWEGEFHNKKKSGELYWEHAVISPLIKNGVITHMVAVKEDITEKKKMLQDLIAAKEKAEELSRLKSNFISNMSHELRTPLVGILGISEFLKKDLQGNERENAELIYISGLRLLKTITEILNFSKIESENPKIEISEVKTAEVIKNETFVYRSLAEEKGVALTLNFQSEPIIYTDERILRIILGSLLSNAVKFTPKGNITVSIYETKLEALIEVMDSGIGIPQEKLDTIFEDFRQVSEGMGRSFEGIGIGLTVAKKYANLLKGTIEVESNPGFGSKFTIHLPLNVHNNFNKRPVEMERTQLTIPKKDCKILIVEDDYINALTIRKMLENKYKILEAHTGPAAIEIVKNERVEIILMDINLKNSIDGMETTQIIRKIKGYEEVPIVAMTAYALPADKQQFIYAGCSHYISKPFAPEELDSLIDEIMETQNII